MNEEMISLKIKEINKGIIKLLFKDYFCDDEFKNFTPTQVKIVHYILNSNNKVYQKDIEKHLNLTRATTSGVLKTMEKHNLIEKVPNDSDARSKEIILKPRTKEMFLKSKEKLQKIENILIKDISKEELELFSEIINKMNNNINNYELTERR